MESKNTSHLFNDGSVFRNMLVCNVAHSMEMDISITELSEPHVFQVHIMPG